MTDRPTKEHGGVLDPDDFVPFRCPANGWTVLCPWVRTEEGYPWRPHLYPMTEDGFSPAAEARARHYATELNAAMDRRKGMRKIDGLISALKVIHTWATFDSGDGLDPTDVAKLCEKVLYVVPKE